jgi:hypothetical protein
MLTQVIIIYNTSLLIASDKSVYQVKAGDFAFQRDVHTIINRVKKVENPTYLLQ